MTQSLTQAELDDAYHLASFHADQAARLAMVEFFKGPRPKQGYRPEELIELVCAALNEAELQYLGRERYDAMMARLMASAHLEKPKQ